MFINLTQNNQDCIFCVFVANLRRLTSVIMTSDADILIQFEKHFQHVVKDLSTPSHSEVNNGIGWSYERIEDILQYNVPYGKKTRGLTVVSSYTTIMGTCTQQDLEIILTLGWAVEILQASFLVADDVMDQSKTRRGKLCWYKNKGIGLQAVNDCMILESCVYTLLRKHCRNMPYYVDLVDLFHKVILSTEMGQSLDMLTSEQPTLDFTVFTKERYAAMIKYKTAFYSFYLPVAIALYVAGISDQETHDQCCSILTRIGSLFQIQDDYLDCYGDPSVTGKIGTDIEDTKCSWLVIEALKLANSEQMQILESCYGQNDPEKVAQVKKLFDSLSLEERFKKFEIEEYAILRAEIENFPNTKVPKSIFFKLLDKIYKRKK